MLRRIHWAALASIAAYVVVAVAPCSQPSGGSHRSPSAEAAERIGEVHAHPGSHIGSDVGSHTAELAPDRAAHAGCPEEAAGLALSAPCPCGCDDPVAAPRTAGGVGLALTSVPPVWVVPLAYAPHARPPHGAGPAPARPIEHVPLPV